MNDFLQNFLNLGMYTGIIWLIQVVMIYRKPYSSSKKLTQIVLLTVALVAVTALLAWGKLYGIGYALLLLVGIAIAYIVGRRWAQKKAFGTPDNTNQR